MTITIKASLVSIISCRAYLSFCEFALIQQFTIIMLVSLGAICQNQFQFQFQHLNILPLGAQICSSSIALSWLENSRHCIDICQTIRMWACFLETWFTVSRRKCGWAGLNTGFSWGVVSWDMDVFPLGNQKKLLQSCFWALKMQSKR